MFSEYIKSTVKGNTELDRESAHLLQLTLSLDNTMHTRSGDGAYLNPPWFLRGGPFFCTGFSILSAKGFRWMGGSEKPVRKDSERIVRSQKPVHLKKLKVICGGPP